MKPRIAIIALLQESNTFLSGLTTIEQFEQDVLLRGDAIRDRFFDAPHEVGGFLQHLSAAGVEVVPLLAARAYPYGTVTAETAEMLLNIISEELVRAGKLDGVLVAPHGATVSERYPDFDGHWLSMVRKYVGDDCPIIGTLDPHGNLSPQMVAATDALFCYRTNPHIDQQARGIEAAELMLKTLRGEAHPVQAACFPPMAINIERQCTNESPLIEYLQLVKAARERRGILGVSLMLGFPYADVREMGSSLLVVADGDPTLAEKTARELAAQLWKIRQSLAGSFIGVAEAVERASLMEGPVCMLDMGDNVGGGSPADGTSIAMELHQRRIGPAIVVIYDPEAVRQAEAAGVGNCVTMAVGGKCDNRHGEPLETEFLVRQIADGVYRETEARHGGFTQFDQGRTAIVQTESGLTVMLTSRRSPPFSLKQLTHFGLDPSAFQILVAKGVNAPLAAYRPVCANVIRVNTPGVTTADMTQLSFQHRRRPLFPFEPQAEWTSDCELPPETGGIG